MTQYQAQYDKQARGWNVVDTKTGRIVGMYGGGKRGEAEARRSVEFSAQLETAWGL